MLMFLTTLFAKLTWKHGIFGACMVPLHRLNLLNITPLITSNKKKKNCTIIPGVQNPFTQPAGSLDAVTHILSTKWYSTLGTCFIYVTHPLYFAADTVPSYTAINKLRTKQARLQAKGNVMSKRITEMLNKQDETTSNRDMEFVQVGETDRRTVTTVCTPTEANNCSTNQHFAQFQQITFR